MDFTSATLTLLLVMDPLGNIPNFMVAVKCVPEARRFRVIARELFIALLILLVVFFGGKVLMKTFQLTEEALRIAGGIMLFLIALRMIFPDHSKEATDLPEEEPFIVPMATPLIAGPSVMATLMLMVGSEPEKRPLWLGAMFAAWAINSAILLFAPFFARVLQRRGLAAVERLMGMILVVVSVQMFLDGLHLSSVK